MSRFNDVVLEVNSFDQAVGITAVISGLKHDRFRDSLIKHAAITFSEVNDRSLKFITAEEYALAQNPTPSKNQNPEWRDDNLSRKRMKMAQNRGPIPTSTPRFGRSNSTPLQQSAGGLSSKQRKLYVREVKHQNRAKKRKFNDAEWKNQPITFTSAGLDIVVTPHNDPLVTSVMINNCEVQRVLVDTGSAPDIMYFHCFESLGLDPALLQKYDGPIYGFNNRPVSVEGVLTLHVAFGSGRTYVTPSVRLLVVKMVSSFNIVIGRPTLTEIRVVVSQSHLCMKFPTPMGIATLRGNQEVARHCYMIYHLEIVDNRPEDETRAAPVEDVEEVLIDDRDPNIPGIPNSVSQHKLSTNPLKKPVAQKRRLFGGERLQAIKEEVEKLLQAGFVRKVDYCEWVANPVLVKKANGKWRMCIDYTNLNQACPKDYYPMPSIDKLVEVASGNERLNLLDAYSGYHQLPMAPEDEEKTSFYAGDEIYCYVMMPFGLKNAGATYQKMVTIVFRAQIGRNLEVYVDDIVDAVKPNQMHLRSGIWKVSRFHGVPKRDRGQSREDQTNCQDGTAEITQALADFIVECTPCPSTPNPEPNDWTLYVDGASSSNGSGAGALLIGPEGYRSEQALKFNFDAINNMVEYEALLLGLQLALELKISAIQVYSDSQLVVNQTNSICEVVDPVMVKYVALVAELKCKFQKFCLSKIPRAENEHADSLSKLASDSSLSSRFVFVETDSIISFLRDGIVPEDRQEAMKLRKKASRYALIDGVLYKRSFSLPLLRCLNPYEAEYALREPNMHKDATYFVQKCPKCQFFAHLTHQPAEELTNLVAPWPFAQWGVDLLSPFVKGVGGVTHLVVGVDYFTKWVEAQPLSSLTSKKLEDFVFSSIICRYGIPNQIVADNGTQFNCSSFRDFCSSYGIKLQFTSVYHPKSNGMVESINKCILEGIKPRLEQHKAKWADELNNVLWAYRTTSQTAIGETPYHLAFGTEAVIPVKIGVPSFRVTHFDEGRNGQLLRENLDLLAKVREEARLRTLVYKQKLVNFYNKRVRPRTFKVGDLVLRKAGLTGFETHFGKLAPNWEGPYTVADVLHPGAYILQDVEGKRVPRVWNVNNLKKFYP
ncbi:hypothetical protein SLEP1_g18002 [Rubroshorea leprosula]|uniref:Uncharacterized protein n=1 Tax=Rubroshorea leprosula TaxID=152421 RepID=A0AAV5J1X3_9ROSI|nr:hypothetical protein SLEP1_g18002 [Rubroshorea leprosula]